MSDISVCYSHNKHRDVAVALSKRIDLPLIDECGKGATLRYLLCVADYPECDYQLTLQFPKEKLSPITFGGGRQQPIARALGLKKGLTPAVVDATAGLGRDAFVLASLGCPVLMLERHPVIHALLEDGLRRLTLKGDSCKPLTERLNLQRADARQWLATNAQGIDVVYLDPMYPHRTKSALVKKEMRVLRQLVGDDLDVVSVLETALQVARQRVVVKRPKTAPAIGTTSPSFSVESKNTRYDIYLTKVTHDTQS